ncbi:transposase [Candidatus Poriferisodalis sp.]|uniref:transposase n=1 Tax=Candidatus Poriferisodalis sp. TaxID=3101277 RepID=UPI003B5ACEAC
MAKSAPGKHYRKGLTLTALFDKFPDDKTAEAWFAAQRWGDRPTCPHCGHDDVQTGAAHKTMPYR